jgi:TetR/AcrR family transcriptional regulator, transcriptional repressor for nem operon
MARPRTFDEATVVGAARDRFRAAGYAATSLDDLVRATGLAKGSLYNAFGDKHALYLRAFENYCDEAVAGFAAQLGGPGDGARERLHALVRDSADHPGSAVAPPVACFLAGATAERAALDPEVAAIAQRTFQRLEDLLERSVSAALPHARDPRALARHVLATLRGFDALSSAGVDPAVLTDAAESLIGSVLS